jgi:hypothetical protein
MIQDVRLGRVQEPAARFVAREGTVLEAVPQAGDDVEELLRPLVAVAVVGVAVEAEVAGLVLDLAGCPPSAPMRQNWVVEERRISGSS